MDVRWISYGSDAYWTAADLRYRLFYQPHGIDRSIVCTGEDSADDHAVLEQNGQILAYGRLAQRGRTEFQILQMVVETAWQGRGLGRQVLKALMTLAERQGGRSLFLNARADQAGFYEQQGFMPVGEEVFASAATGVSHIKMEKQLEHNP